MLSFCRSALKVNNALSEFSCGSGDGVSFGDRNQGECSGIWGSGLADGKKFVGVEPLEIIGAGVQDIGEDRTAGSDSQGKIKCGINEDLFVPELVDAGLTDDMSPAVQSNAVYNTEKVHRRVFSVLSRRLSAMLCDKSSRRTNSSVSRRFFHDCHN